MLKGKCLLPPGKARMRGSKIKHTLPEAEGVNGTAMLKFAFLIMSSSIKGIMESINER
jgi:hypothetical protein